MNANLAFRLAAGLGFFAVVLGASGAHGPVNALLVQHGTLANWQTAVLYHLVHTVMLLLVAHRQPFQAWAWRFFALGILLFSGSLYLLALTEIKRLGAITPFGGLCLLAGWLCLALGKTKGTADPRL
jgi:uncharacterized membrane protein YgdD (TMEM256/DUF423 family)